MIQQRNIARRGFSLIELSIAIGIISMAMVAGISMGGGALRATDRVTTQQRLATIKYALDSYAKMNGFLPCPAERNLTPTSASFGMEVRESASSCVPGNTVSINRSGAVTTYTGAVPVKNLGLPDSYAADAWNNKIDYTVDQAHIYASSNYSSNAGVLTVQTGDVGGTNYGLTGSYRNNTSNTITAINPAAGLYRLSFGAPVSSVATGDMVFIDGLPKLNGYHVVTRIDNTTYDLQGNMAFDAAVAAGLNASSVMWRLYNQPSGSPSATYFLVSHGPNSKCAFPLGGTAQSSYTAGLTETANCTGTGTIKYDSDYNDTSTSATSFFDDYVAWGSNLQQRAMLTYPVYENLCPAGTCAEWCAKCVANIPSSVGSNTAYDTARPPNLVVSTASANTAMPKLCQKFIVRTAAAACEAACIWSGSSQSTNPNPGYMPCP